MPQFLFGIAFACFAISGLLKLPLTVTTLEHDELVKLTYEACGGGEFETIEILTNEKYKVTCTKELIK